MRKHFAVALTAWTAIAIPAAAQPASDILDDTVLERLGAEYDFRSGDVSGAPRLNAPQLPAPPEDPEFGGALALRSGYDTNYDESTTAVGSPFATAEGEVEVSRRLGAAEVFAAVGGTLTQLPFLTMRTRFEGDAEAGVLAWLAPKVVVEGAVRTTIDGTDDPVILENEGAVALRVLEDGFAFGLRLSAGSTRAVATLDPGGTFDPNDGALDEIGAEATLLLLPQSRISPVVAAATGWSADPTFNPAGAVYGDAARDDTLLVGLRLVPVDDLAFTAGARILRREAADPAVGTLLAVAPEAEVEWGFAKDWEVSGSLRTHLDAPGVAGSAGEKVTTASAELKYDPDDGPGFRFKASHRITEEAGVASLDTRTKASLEAHYRWQKIWLVSLNAYGTYDWGAGGTSRVERIVLSGGVDVDF